ncbi:MAG: NUDIX domain-containing protein [Ginsengibacter sp.]
MPKKSAGILIYSYHNNLLQVLLVHPGGPFWAKKDLGAWSVPKGEIEEDENPLDAAKREVEEETGIKILGDFVELTPIKQKSGKMVYAWAIKNDLNAAEITSNTFETEWPPKSGIKKRFPEIDKAAWFNAEEAKKKIIEGQVPLIEELQLKLKDAGI